MTTDQRQTIARIVMALNIENKREDFPHDATFNGRIVDDAYANLKAPTDSSVNQLMKCINDYNTVPGYIGIISRERTAVNFDCDNQQGIIIKTGNGKWLVLTSDARLAEITPLNTNNAVDENSKIEYLSLDSVAAYGDFRLLAYELEKNIGLVNRHITNVHKHTHPELYFGGKHVYMEKDDYRNILAAKDAEYKAYREALSSQVGPST